MRETMLKVLQSSTNPVQSTLTEHKFGPCIAGSRPGARPELGRPSGSEEPVLVFFQAAPPTVSAIRLPCCCEDRQAMGELVCCASSPVDADELRL